MLSTGRSVDGPLYKTLGDLLLQDAKKTSDPTKSTQSKASTLDAAISERVPVPQTPVSSASGRSGLISTLNQGVRVNVPGFNERLNYPR